MAMEETGQVHPLSKEKRRFPKMEVFPRYSFEVQLQSISMPSSIHPSIRHFNGQVATGCSREEISLANETNETNEARPGWGQPASQPNSAN
jgi:hypothetical protein